MITYQVSATKHINERLNVPLTDWRVLQK